jgi:ATP-binding cassette subfamily C protein LapB
VKRATTKLHWKQRILSFKFSDSSKEILHGLTLKIEQGERIAIYGANGSGKTTLIRILSGLLHPTLGLCTSMMIRLEK